jgi:signal transduction histidine kinase
MMNFFKNTCAKYPLAAVVAFVILCDFTVACRHSSNTITSKTYSKEDSLYVTGQIDKANEVVNTNFDSAFIILESIKDFSTKKKFYCGLFEYYCNSVAYTCSQGGEFNKAWILYDSMHQLLTRSGLPKYEFITNYTKGYLYQSQQDNDSAIAYYLKALQSPVVDSTRMPAVNQCMAILFYYQGNYKEAVEYQTKVLQINKQYNDTPAIISASTNLYGFTMAMKDTNAARNNIFAALAYVNEKKPLLIYASTFLNTGEYYLAVNKIDSSIKYLNKFLAFVDGRYAPEASAQPRITLAKAYLLKKDYAASSRLLKEVETLESPDSMPILAKHTYLETKYALLKHLGNTAAALAVHEQLLQLKEERQVLEKNEQLLQYDRREKDLVLEKQLMKAKMQVQQKNNNFILLSVAGGAAIFSLLMGLLYWRKRKKGESEKISLLLKEKQLEKENAQLQGQLEERNRISQELHDELGATMTSISLAVQVLQMNKEKLAGKEIEIIERASSEMTDKMNEIVWSLNTNNDTLQSLVAYIRKFASDFLTDAKVLVNYNEHLDNPEQEVSGVFRRNVYHAGKEAINNIVKHAGASEVNISIKSNTQDLKILIQDNGKGFSGGVTEGWSNGLRNMKKNIEKIGGTIAWKNNNGIQVAIEVPFLSDYKV